MADAFRYPIATLAASDLGGEVSGDPRTEARLVANLENAGPGCLAFCLAGRLADLATANAAVVLAPLAARAEAPAPAARAVVWVEDPMAAFVAVLTQNGYANPPAPGRLAEGGYFLADDAQVGAGTEIYPLAALHAGTVVGGGCRIQSGAVLGAVGLGYAAAGQGYLRLPHLGRLVLGDDVDIGANAVLVRGILQDTVVGSGTRVGNQVNIGHNAAVGRDCFISAGAVLAGSVRLGDRVWVAPNATLLNGVRVGDGARIGPGAVLNRDAEAGWLYLGNPARAIKKTDE